MFKCVLRKRKIENSKSKSIYVERSSVIELKCPVFGAIFSGAVSQRVNRGIIAGASGAGGCGGVLRSVVMSIRSKFFVITDGVLFVGTTWHQYRFRCWWLIPVAPIPYFRSVHFNVEF